MTRARFAPLALSTVALATALLLSGCTSAAPAADPTPTGNAVSPTPTEALPGPTPDTSPTTGGAVGNLIEFGWAPISTADAETVAAQLEKEGWRREPADSGFYITQDPSRVITVDDKGYGMTYQFGDGWVAVSDTKQNLLLMPVTAG